MKDDHICTYRDSKWEKWYDQIQGKAGEQIPEHHHLLVVEHSSEPEV